MIESAAVRSGLVSVSESELHHRLRRGVARAREEGGAAGSDREVEWSEARREKPTYLISATCSSTLRHTKPHYGHNAG